MPPRVAPTHEVLRVLAARVGTSGRPYGDGLRVALAIEGGGMRGVISAGMALELHERGLVPAFDAVYGSSAGAITGAWLLSSRPEGLLGWTETAYAKTLIRRSGLLRGRPAVDVRTLIEELYQTTFPMDFASVLASPVEYHRSSITPPSCGWPCEPARPCRCLPDRRSPSPGAGSTTPACPSRSRTAPR
jgi:hypothetical protein